MVVLVVLIVGLLGLALTPRLTRGWTRRERNLAYLSWLAHLVSAPAQELIYRRFYGGGDMLVYQRRGEMLTALIERYPARWVPEVGALLLQQETRLPFVVTGDGTSTGSMCAVAGFLGVVLGSSLTAQGAVIGLLSFTGKCASHATLRVGLASRGQAALAFGQLLVPTTVLWSAALLKEPVVGGALGWLIFATGQVIRRRHLGYLALALACSAFIGLFKAYLLVGVAIGVAAWVYASRQDAATFRITLRPVRALFALAIGAALVAILGRVFPQYDVSEVAGRVADLQEYAEVGGSSYEFGDSSARTIGQQLRFAPLALVSSFFRPFPFEISSATAAVNALESFAVLCLFAGAWWRHRPPELLRRLIAFPAFAFAFAYAVSLGVGVGLATSNLGTLSRYRAPFYAMVVSVGILWYLARRDLFPTMGPIGDPAADEATGSPPNEPPSPREKQANAEPESRTERQSSR